MGLGKPVRPHLAAMNQRSDFVRYGHKINGHKINSYDQRLIKLHPEWLKPKGVVQEFTLAVGYLLAGLLLYKCVLVHHKGSTFTTTLEVISAILLFIYQSFRAWSASSIYKIVSTHDGMATKDQTSEI